MAPKKLKAMARDYSLFSQVLGKIKNGMTITLREKDCVDSFLIFNDADETQTITFHTNRVPYWLEFDKDEPILLEDCPDGFLRTLLKNL